MKVYADPITVNCRKVLAGLDLIGAPYELQHVDYFNGEQKGAAYTAINPNQRAVRFHFIRTDYTRCAFKSISNLTAHVFFLRAAHAAPHAGLLLRLL